ncbi:hypothetical protein [Bradyrhizobium elkanii]
MSRRRQLQIIREQIHAELRDGLNQAIAISFVFLIAVDLIARSIR